ncbi:MAG: hypothetical protein ACRDHF_03760 [Tepidiformaceae bacterium]
MTAASLFQRGRVTLPSQRRKKVYVAWRCDRVYARAMAPDTGDSGSPLGTLAGTPLPFDYGTPGTPTVMLALSILAHHLGEDEVAAEDLEQGSHLASCPACDGEPDCPDCRGLGFQLVALRSAREAPAFAADFLVNADPTLPLVILGERIDRWLRVRSAPARTLTSTLRAPTAHESRPEGPKGDQ